MKNSARTLKGGLAMLAACVRLAPGAAGAETPAKADAPVAVTPPAAEPRAKAEMIGYPNYRPAVRKAGEWNGRPDVGVYHPPPSLYGWRMTLPDGTGLAFGGLWVWDHKKMANGQPQDRIDDPAMRTDVLKDGKWVPIHEELCRKNPLQPHYERWLVLEHQLHRAASRARHIYFEGRDEAAEKAFLNQEVAPLLTETLKGLREVKDSLAAVKGDAYVTGQAVLAHELLDKVFPPAEGLGSRTTPEKLKALRLARIDLERAADALRAEPPPRVLSMLAYDAKTGLYAIFGGDHLDYLTNDLWVFDPQAQRRMQRHPQSAPCPRLNRILEGDGTGVLKMRGGGVLHPQYNGFNNVAPEEWNYDLASDSWTGPAGATIFPNSTRQYWANRLPDVYAGGPRPDAAAHGKLLAGLPANQWEKLPTPRGPGAREWGRVFVDPERDLIYSYNGGHVAYAGSDVAHYHLATDRWDHLVEFECPPALVGGDRSLPGQSFNRRPRVPSRSWNSYAFHKGIRRVVAVGRVIGEWGPDLPDNNTYLYDPDLGDWEKRVPVPNSMVMACKDANVLWVPPLGVIKFAESGILRFDETALKWQRMAVKGGRLPGTPVDACGQAYDPKRQRVLLFIADGCNGPYFGEVAALAVPSLEVSRFKPEGCELFKAWGGEDMEMDPARRHLPSEAGPVRLQRFVACGGRLHARAGRREQPVGGAEGFRPCGYGGRLQRHPLRSQKRPDLTRLHPQRNGQRPVPEPEDPGGQDVRGDRGGGKSERE